MPQAQQNLCPLLMAANYASTNQQDSKACQCIKEKCAWFHQKQNIYAADCVVVQLTQALADIPKILTKSN